MTQKQREQCLKCIHREDKAFCLSHGHIKFSDNDCFDFDNDPKVKFITIKCHTTINPGPVKFGSLVERMFERERNVRGEETKGT